MKRLAVLALVAALGLPGLAQDAPKPKAADGKRNDDLRRACVKAHAASEFGLTRLTMVPNDEGRMVVAEYQNGDLALFKASDDSDQFILIDQANVILIEEAIVRAKLKAH